ncbi:MAG: SUMF1/EgtB/PvdO family nonheme iron enzyme [Gammaproteobacteria bacterium]|nr:SUMF1/EgtB/PvdO family nonheme iron enzyme [Gammaproteobacteria bacterium]
MTLASDDLQDLGKEVETKSLALKRNGKPSLLAARAGTYASVAMRPTWRCAEGEQEEPQSLREIMKCKGDLTEEDLRDLDTVLNGPGTVPVEGYSQPLEHQGMRGTFPAQFEIDRPGVVQALSGCISRRIAVRDPDRAREVKSRILNMINAQQIANIVIDDLDPCAKRNLEGRGSMNGSWCSDRLSVGGSGPELVVVPPPPGAQEKFAISRIEIKRSDYNRFCEETGCELLPGTGTLPATNISLEQARAYTSWLSDQTGRSYRLPTADEWRYAAETNREEAVDDNVNCTVDARGVRLGDKLLSTLSGRPNRWGLYNYVGNAREWALGEGEEEVLAMGGAHTDPKSECTLDKKVPHTGNPDPVTGFRIVRAVED